eukprot:CAMPEP_0174269868 /NCGR_PEP_ID=MMETSP0439-20130205/42556_1 /TAXON_ID=0 /ORGANISM="Stereomyxa ramosa, Strain Chinc5" /LENGTH=62 /DNA_ID=CAMNT_0015358855 /DNA_START=217 /DNA_END=405 /DNA_ORIENTATION=+
MTTLSSNLTFIFLRISKPHVKLCCLHMGEGGKEVTENENILDDQTLMRSLEEHLPKKELLLL